MSEKRKYMRFDLSLKGKPNIQIIDFSREGLKISFPQDVFLKTNPVKLECYLPNRELPIAIEGRTRWTRPVGSDWHMGMRIKRIVPAEKNEILDYAYKLWKEREIAR